MSEFEEEETKEELLHKLDNDFLLGIINKYLPEKQKISSEKGRILIPEAKKLFLSMENQKPMNEEFDLGIDFFKEAKKDLKRSKHSYFEKDFSDSTYHLQQATEKLMKSYGLVQGTFTKKDLFKINHQTPKAFIQMIKERIMARYLSSLKQINPELNIDTSDLKKTIETQDKELALLNAEQLNSWLNMAEKIDAALNKTDLDNILKNILPDLAKAQGKKVTYPKFSVIKFSSIFIKMYLVSVITYPHESFTRYPGGDIKPSQYDENMGIVKVTERLFLLLDEAFTMLDEFIHWKNENKP